MGETRIIDADTGRWVTIKDLIEGRTSIEATFSCNNELRIEKRRIVAVTESGTKTVYKLRTALGREIEATAEHPFLTISGWRRLGELQVGDAVASARSLAPPGRKRWARHKIIVLADLIAEGNLCHPSTFYFYTTDPEHRDEFVRSVERFGNTCAVVELHRSCFSIRVRRKDISRPTKAVEWVKELRIWGVGAREKSLPHEVFELRDSDIGLLLARLWEGDGHIAVGSIHADYDTSSRQLAQEIQHLLLRLGVVARIYRRVRSYRGREMKGYVVTVTGNKNLRRFYERIGRRFLGVKKRRQSRELAAPTSGRMSKDVIPAEVRDLIRRERDDKETTWKAIGCATGLGMREIQGRSKTKKGFRREVIERLARHFESKELTRLATSDLYWDRITSIERTGSRMTYDLEIEGNHNFLANDLVVHNSHAASFALIAYATAYLKCHYLPEFTCALLNSWPMGFYTPATIVQDGKRHGLVVRPVDVLHSVWTCTMEACEHSTGGFAIRMGLRYVKGLREDEGEKIEAAVRAAGRSRRGNGTGSEHLANEQPVPLFASIDDFASRTCITNRSMGLLAEAGAFDSLKENRRAALWRVQGMKKEAMRLYGDQQKSAAGAAGRVVAGGVAEPDLPLGETIPTFRSLSDIDTVAWDFRTMNHSARSHLLEPFRDELVAKGLPDAGAVSRMNDGRRVDYAGIVICRQRPGTASGVVFMTMEDETGFVNTILWPSVYEQFTVQARTLSFLGVSGKVQAADGVVHVVVDKLWDPREYARPTAVQSRDFH
ncbi:MAG: hypothetical protein O7H39_18495 [Gammaproteobacteria bacterium]|nr:hypothetical protein [Gammaproteobacteria bacterium]